MKKIDQIMLKNRGKCKVSSCIPKGSEDKQRTSFFFFNLAEPSQHSKLDCITQCKQATAKISHPQGI